MTIDFNEGNLKAPRDTMTAETHACMCHPKASLSPPNVLGHTNCGKVIFPHFVVLHRINPRLKVGIARQMQSGKI